MGASSLGRGWDIYRNAVLAAQRHKLCERLNKQSTTISFGNLGQREVILTFRFIFFEIFFVFFLKNNLEIKKKIVPLQYENKTTTDN